MSRALLASILLHGLVVAAAIGLWREVSPTLKLSGDGRPFSIARVFLTGGPSASTEPAAAKPKETLRRNRASLVSVPATEVAVEPSTTDAGAGTAESSPGGQPASVGGDGLGAGGAAEGTVTDWRFVKIRERIEKAKAYPALARARQETGVVKMRFRIAESGKPREIEILRSSGYPLLDRAAVETVERAGPYPVVDGFVTFPLRFDLVDRS